MVVSLQFNLVESLWQTFWRHQSSDNKSAHGDDDEGSKDTWFVFIYICGYIILMKDSVSSPIKNMEFLSWSAPAVFHECFFFLAHIQYELK